MMDYTIFGESHGPAVGVLLRDVPPGLPVDEEFICRQLLRRAPQDPLSTARHEPDQVEVLSGVYQGVTTGMPVCLLLRNRDVRSADYDALRHTPRPSHADYTAWVQSGGRNDPRGGGAFSGRLTAPLVAAGALAKSWLNLQDIEVNAQVIDENALRQRAEAARQTGDSVGGQVRCIVTGLPAGWGGPDWRETVESEIARHVFAIPGVKAVAFGAGEEFAVLRGSQANDPWRTDGRRVWSATNHSGGINGGITNGMPVEFTVTFRPTPSIAQPQETIDLETMTNTKITIGGRHDACIALRAPVVVESAAALALWRLKGADGGGELDDLRGQLDILDTELTTLFVQRQSISRRIGAYKREHHLPVQDAGREEQVLHTRGDLAPERRQQVERLAGRTVAQLFSGGEECFRHWETAALQALCAGEDCVLATGGGAVLRPENRALLRRSGVVFWLDRPVADIERTLERANRPLLAGGGSLETLRRQREALYRICADYAIRENTAQAAAEAIAAIWRKQT